ncbi:AAA family ATPase [uncultured Cardiobacterium sp.]|uniref:AAA family ATPase n=1 Tax=uncultured Cardiobacterium sp. TaxID=417619 RepID=UPI002622E2E3|nr:AAA family ATPase [uncultured Cardiobacterium sp.]
MNALAHYLAARHGCPGHGDSLAALLTALQEAHDNGDTLIHLHTGDEAPEEKKTPPLAGNTATKAPPIAGNAAQKAPPLVGEGLGWGQQTNPPHTAKKNLSTDTAHISEKELKNPSSRLRGAAPHKNTSVFAATRTVSRSDGGGEYPPQPDNTHDTFNSAAAKAPPPVGEGLGRGLEKTSPPTQKNDGDEAQSLTETTLAALAAHNLIGDGSRPTPLVRHGAHLWYYRNYHNEARLAAAIHARLDDLPPPAAATAADPGLRPEQQAAVALARHGRLTLINGGPGTGKTHTLAHLIAAELRAHPARRIALAAPTGKAANRMEESLARATAALPASAQDAIRRATGRARTLHRLLGIGTDGIPQYHAARHLPYDDIIIDEASMLSLELAAALFAATAPATRLILLGDADQLAAVEPGAILHDLSHHPALQTRRITLRDSARFSADSGIGRLAAILGSGGERGARFITALHELAIHDSKAPPPVAMTADTPPSRHDEAPKRNTAPKAPLPPLAGEGWGECAPRSGITADNPPNHSEENLNELAAGGNKAPPPVGEGFGERVGQIAPATEHTKYSTSSDTTFEHNTPPKAPPPPLAGEGWGGGIPRSGMTADNPPSRHDKAPKRDTPPKAPPPPLAGEGWGEGVPRSGIAADNPPNHSAQTPPIHWHPAPDADTYRALLAPYRAYLALLQNPDADPQALLAAYDQYRILCAGHHGALGTIRINAALRLLHQRAHHIDTAHNHYHGLPLMILANDHRRQLYNGDTGICLDSPHGLQLHLPGRDAVPLARLNPANLADAYALTIHKSQGSEYARVALALDAHSERLLSRELLYTGITRSKGALDLYADAATLARAADTPTARTTGLAWHLSRLTDTAHTT